MASLGDFAAELITALGGRDNPASEKFFNAWQRWEGGMTANSATWNPFNLTAPGSGFPTINSVGVVAMPSKAVGVQRTAALLKSGYPTLARAMATGQINFANPAIQGDLNRWLTGKRTPGMSAYVSKIASAYGQPQPSTPYANAPYRPGATATPAPPGATPTPRPQQPYLDPLKLSSKIQQGFLTGKGRINILGLPGLVQSSWVTPAAPSPISPQRGVGASPAPPSASPPGGGAGVPGKVIVSPTANRKGVPLNPGVLSFVAQVAGVYGKPLTIGTGSNHNQYVLGTHRQSAHWIGNAADIPSSGAALTRLGQDALIAAGMNPVQARKQTGGVFNIGGYQILFNTMVGGDHYNHLHVGLR